VADEQIRLSPERSVLKMWAGDDFRRRRDPAATRSGGDDFRRRRDPAATRSGGDEIRALSEAYLRPGYCSRVPDWC
jgi:hypothetical protein